ncbi:acyltransferase domain-containing protein, partial [Actinomadura sp. DC4]|uniref:acyltransferase domain-containing protein n=1 Tax=Actinomadura sp. DC4 TaxID=3055069 RepID=UPI0025AED0EE
PQALRDQARRLRDHLARHDAEPADVAYTLATARAHHQHRAALTDPTALDDLAGGDPSPHLIQATTTDPGKTVFVFPGQGSQWPGMAAALMRTSPTFAQHMTTCAQALAPYLDQSPIDALTDPTAHQRVDIIQPTLFAVMVSLAELWQAAGIHPDAVIGHSQGEIAAAHIAGALTLDDAARIIALRSQALTHIT